MSAYGAYLLFLLSVGTLVPLALAGSFAIALWAIRGFPWVGRR